MAFENDILISYAHLDDQSLVEGQPGWIAHLHRLLEIRIGQFLGEKPKIWRDPKLRGNDYFADTIVSEQIPKVATLLTVVSPRYVKSEWCLREVKEFFRASEETGGVRIGNKARIFKVIKTPISLDRHPAELQPLLGYEFYVTDQAGRPRGASQTYGPDAERKFLTLLDDLAYDIAGLLEQLKPEGTRTFPTASMGTVYLAETSHDLREERQAVRRDLVRNGYQVLPDQSLPLVADELAAFVHSELARSTLSIHLVGRGYGVVPDGETRSVIAIQQEIAAARGAAGLRRLIWLPPEMKVMDDRQRDFIEHLRTDPAVHASAEVLEIPLEDLKSVVHQRLQPPEVKKEKAQEKTPSGAARESVPVRVYLLYDQQDLDAVRPLEDHLFDQGFEVVPPTFDDDEAQARQDHEENLGACDAVLLYYGEAGEPWLRRKQREIQKSAGLGRERPLLACGIYIAPPATPQKERFRTLEALMLHADTAAFSPAALAPFLAEIARRKAAP